MCGIFSIANVSHQPVKGLSDFVSDALIAGAVRGDDSCGIALMDSQSNVRMHKDVLAPTSFLTSRATKALLDEVDHAYMVLGHNRAATVGDVTVDAAHPFHLTDDDTGVSIIGVHNGTLSGYKLKEGNKSYISDSEWLFAQLLAASNLDDDKREQEVSDILAGMWGAYAVMFFFDDDPTRLYIATNGKRPIHCLMSSDSKYLLMASEPGMLHWLAERNKLDTTDNVLEAQADKLYVIDLGEEKITYRKMDIEWTRSFRSAAPAAANSTSEYTGTLADLDKLASKYGVTVESATPSTSTSIVPFDTVAKADDDLASAIAAVRGASVEFFIGEADKNTRTMFGTFWPADNETEIKSPLVQRLMYEGKLVIYCGRDEQAFNKMYSQPDAIWTGNITSVVNIDTLDSKTGKMIKVPTAVIQLSSIKASTTEVARAVAS